MKRFLTLAVLLVGLTAQAQFGSMYADQPFLAKDELAASNPEDVLPLGKKYWWKASDVTNSPVDVWIDRIEGLQFTQSGSLRPTWTTNGGVHFDGSSQQMTNNMTADSLDLANGACFAVIDFETTAANQMVVCNDYSGGNILFGIGGTANYFYMSPPGNSALGPITSSIFDILTPIMGVNSYAAYTNGVASQWARTTAWNSSGEFRRIGAGASTGYGHVSLHELIVWTNTGAWTSTMISNVHWYATNTYSFSP